jgi:hypothetical protein
MLAARCSVGAKFDAEHQEKQMIAFEFALAE